MESKFAAIKTKKIYEEVIDQVTGLITSGELKPGDRFPAERELAQHLGISRPSMREAFSILTMLGVIESRPGDGTYVVNRLPASLLSPMARSFLRTKREILDSYEVRAVLEIEAARLAAERATEEELVQLNQIKSQLSERYAAGDVPEDGDTSLHMAIAQISHNEVLFHLLKDIQHILLKISKVFYRASRAGATGEERARAAVADFDRLVSAIQSGNPDLAGQAMTTHLAELKPLILAELSAEDAEPE